MRARRDPSHVVLALYQNLQRLRETDCVAGLIGFEVRRERQPVALSMRPYDLRMPTGMRTTIIPFGTRSRLQRGPERDRRVS